MLLNTKLTEMECFYSVFDNVSRMNPKQDLITVSLKERLNWWDRLVAWICGGFSEKTKQKIHLPKVAKEIKCFVQTERRNLKIQHENGHLCPLSSPFENFVSNIETIRERYVAKHKTTYEDSPTYQYLSNAIRVLRRIQGREDLLGLNHRVPSPGLSLDDRLLNALARDDDQRA